MSSKIIPQESLTAFERWELPVVGKPPFDALLPKKEKKEEGPRAPTAEEIELIQKQAYDEAYKEGYEHGLKEGREAGRTEGHAAGQEIGLAEARAQMKVHGEQLDKILATLEAPFTALDEQVEQELAALAMACAKHLVRRELRTDPGQVVAVVRAAVSALPAAARDIRVFLHPEDAALVREALSLNAADGEVRWKIVEEPVLTRGGCQVETENSRIDATVESRLAAIIAQALGGERGSDGAA